MNIRFRTLIALALIAFAGIGGVVKPGLSIERAPASALQFNAALTNPDLQFADFYDAAEPDLQFALQFNAAPTNPDLQFAKAPITPKDFYDAAEPDLQFALSIESTPGRLNPELQFG